MPATHERDESLSTDRVHTGRTERTYGKFCRVIEIPEHVRAEAAVATFNNGVLEIEMPAIPIPEVNKRTVEIKG